MRRKKKDSRPFFLLCVLVVAVIAVISNLGGTAKTEDREETRSAFTAVSQAVSGRRLGGSPAESADEWWLILVNLWNEVPQDYDVTLKKLKNGHAVDTRCYPDLQQMMDDCRAEGLSPLICSSYRTREKQERLYGNKVDELIAQGYPSREAQDEAEKIVARPGTSEHELGLAVDIVAESYQLLDDRQEETGEQQWLMQNSWRYGFILRYPADKSDHTGIVYEPWHYRYVGREAAAYIYEQGICLEEYIERLS